MPRTELKSFQEASSEMNRLYQKYFMDKNYDAIAAMYSKDCTFMPAGFPMQKGTGDIAGFWKMAKELGFYSLYLETLEIVGPIGDHAMERCRFVFHDEKGNELQIGKYLMMWKKVEGEWKYLWELWNADSM